MHIEGFEEFSGHMGKKAVSVDSNRTATLFNVIKLRFYFSQKGCFIDNFDYDFGNILEIWHLLDIVNRGIYERKNWPTGISSEKSDTIGGRV
jgi:hypothetical protein